MDPQLRQLLEVTYEATEDGMSLAHLSNKNSKNFFLRFLHPYLHRIPFLDDC